MKLPRPSGQYTPRMEVERNRQIEAADAQNRKQGRDVDVGSNKLILKSPDGTRWQISVNDSGTITATAL